jgi:hypothetical protein
MMVGTINKNLSIRSTFSGLLLLDVAEDELFFVEQQRHIADGVVKSCDVGDDDATPVVERRSAPGHVDTETSKPR